MLDKCDYCGGLFKKLTLHREKCQKGISRLKTVCKTFGQAFAQEDRTRRRSLAEKIKFKRRRLSFEPAQSNRSALPAEFEEVSI